MADLKISQLTAGNPAQTGDEIPIARSGANFKITAGSISALPPTTAGANQVIYVDSTGTTLDGDANFTFNGTVLALPLGTQALPSLTATGDTDTGIYFPAANNVAITANATRQFNVLGTASAVNYVQVTGAATGVNPTISVQGSDASRGLNFNVKGATYFNFYNQAGTTQVFSAGGANTSNGNWIVANSAALGSAPTLGSAGSDTNINLVLTPKGTGQVQETVGATNYALASQYDVGTAPNQIPLNQYLGTMAFQDSVAVSVGQLRANTSNGIGYSTGAGGAVTQATSRTTGVTLNTICGAITLVSAAGTTAWQSFTVTNSAVAATDTVIVSQKSGTDLNQIFVTAVSAGSFRISFATTGGTTTEQPVFNFAVIKAVAA